MVLFLVLSLLTAVTHHLFYFSLHHRKVFAGNRQQWPVRIGAGLTFLTVALSNIAVGAAFSQYVWTTLRTKTLSLRGTDHLFALMTDATGLFSKEIITRAKSVATLALLAW